MFTARNILRMTSCCRMRRGILRCIPHGCTVRLLRTSSIARDLIFPDVENTMLHKILRQKPECKDTLIPLEADPADVEQVSEEEWKGLVEASWDEAQPEAVAEAFFRATAFAKQYVISISDPRLSGICAALAGCCAALDDARLLRCLRRVGVCAQAPSVGETVFCALWKALDKECKARCKRWNERQLLFAADHWAALRLSRKSAFVDAALLKVLRRAPRLPAALLVQALFYANAQRDPSSVADMIEVEVALERHLESLSLEDLAVAAAAFFKGQTKMRSERVLSHMLQRAADEAGVATPIVLASILKVVRYSATPSLGQRLYTLLDRLRPEVEERLSLLAAVHAALAGTNMQMLHEGLVRAVAERVVAERESVRVKDLERMALVYSLFDLPARGAAVAPGAIASSLRAVASPAAPRGFAFFAPAPPVGSGDAEGMETAVEQELRRRLGGAELQRHAKSLPRALCFLSTRRIFPEDLIAHALHPDVLRETYGKNSHAFDLELLSLDVAVELERPNYDGPRLSTTERNVIAKRFRRRLPLGEDRGAMGDRLLAQLLSAVCTVASASDCAAIRHLLPQVARADVVVRLDAAAPRPTFLPLPDAFLREPPSGTPHRAPPPAPHAAHAPHAPHCERWMALVPLGKNAFLQGDGGGCRISGPTALHLRHLALLGYTPVMVPWQHWIRLSSAQRPHFLMELLGAAVAAPEGAIVALAVDVATASAAVSGQQD